MHARSTLQANDFLCSFVHVAFQHRRCKLWFRGVSLFLWDASHQLILIFCGLPREPTCVASRESAPSRIVSCSHLLGAVCELITRKVKPCAFFKSLCQWAQ